MVISTGGIWGSEKLIYSYQAAGGVGGGLQKTSGKGIGIQAISEIHRALRVCEKLR